MQKTGLQKQIIIIVSIAAAFVIFLGFYFFLIKPMLEEEPEIPDSAQTEIDKHGQTVINGNPFILEPVDYDQISRIDVENEHGGYSAYRDGENFYIQGAEKFELDYEKTAALRVDTCYLYALEEVEGADLENLADYGFESPLASFTVTKTDGTSYRIIIGEKIPTLGGYYAMLEGRQAIYVLGTDIENTVLAPAEEFLNTMIIPPVSSSLFYSCKDFYLKKNGELFVALEMVDEKNVVTFGNQGTHKMTYPTAYTPSVNNISAVFQTFISFVGDKVVKFAPDAEDLTAYGFLDENGVNISDYEMYCKYDTMEAYIYFSKKDDTTYYVMSPSTNIICEVSAESLYFFEWELINWVNRSIFSMNINDVSSISVSFDGVKNDFEIIGEDQNIKAFHGENELAIKNFKQYYMSLLYITIVGYESKPDGVQPDLEMAVVTDYGETIEYAFYDVSDRKTFFTINGKGEFYVSRDFILKLKEDTHKVIAGETVVGNPNA